MELTGLTQDSAASTLQRAVHGMPTVVKGGSFPEYRLGGPMTGM